MGWERAASIFQPLKSHATRSNQARAWGLILIHAGRTASWRRSVLCVEMRNSASTKMIASHIKRIYNNPVGMKLKWDETKRASNLAKHGLDFANASSVLDSVYRLDVEILRGDELRVMSFSYVLEVLAVLTVVHTARDKSARIISFRPASNEEREVYYGWLESE